MNHCSASAGSVVVRVRWQGPSRSASAASIAARRSANGRSTNDSSPSASRSKATYDAGVFSASMVIRDSAGWIRSWRISNSSRDSPAPPSATNSSPSSTHRSGSCSRAAATTSGKYRVSGFVFRDASSTSSPSLNTRHRNPSHFGSNDNPPNFPGSGMPFTGFANIGCTGGITGRSMPATLAKHATPRAAPKQARAESDRNHRRPPKRRGVPAAARRPGKAAGGRARPERKSDAWRGAGADPE